MSIYNLEKCSAKGSFSSNSTTATFDSKQNMAKFENMQLNATGMYIVSVNVRSLNTSEYNINCLSAPIIVKTVRDTLLTAQNREPDIYLTFSGNFTNLSQESLNIFEAMLYNCLLVDFSLLLQRSFTIYQGSIKAVVGTDGDASSYTNLLTSLNNSNFSLANGIELQSGIIEGVNFGMSQANSNETTSSEIQAQQAKDNSVNFLS